MQRNPHIIEELANNVRKRLGIWNIESPCLVSVLKNLHRLIKGLRFEIVPKSALPHGVEAMAILEELKIMISESTFQDLERGNPRARFTIAHEIGHIVLDHGGLRRRGEQAAYLSPERRIQENEANLFAEYLLAPTELAKRYGNSEEIAEHFQISIAAAEIRLKNIERETRIASRIRRPLPRTVVDFMLEQEKRGIFRYRSLPDSDRE